MAAQTIHRRSRIAALYGMVCFVGPLVVLIAFCLAAPAAEPIKLCAKNPRWFAWRGQTTALVTSGEAELQKFVMVLPVELNVANLPQGSYQLRIRRAGAQWNVYPVLLE